LLLALGMNLCACAGLNSVLVTPPVEAPVVAGPSGNWRFALGSVPTHEYEFTDDASERPPDLTHPEMEEATATRGIFLNVGYLPVERLQIGVDFHPFYLSLVEPKVKFQFLGRPGEGFQAALLGRVGFTSVQKDGDQNGNFGPGGYDWKGKTSGQSFSGGLSLGYYASPTVLIYVGGNYGAMKVKADLDHEESSDHLSPAAHYSVDDKGSLLSLGAGVLFGTQSLITVGYNYSEVDYEKTPTVFGHELVVSLDF